MFFLLYFIQSLCIKNSPMSFDKPRSKFLFATWEASECIVFGEYSTITLRLDWTKGYKTSEWYLWAISNGTYSAIIESTPLPLTFLDFSQQIEEESQNVDVLVEK